MAGAVASVFLAYRLAGEACGEDAFEWFLVGEGIHLAAAGLHGLVVCLAFELHLQRLFCWLASLTLEEGGCIRHPVSSPLGSRTDLDRCQRKVEDCDCVVGFQEASDGWDGGGVFEEGVEFVGLVAEGFGLEALHCKKAERSI